MTTREIDLFVKAIGRIVSEDMELGRDKIASKELWERVERLGIKIPHNKAGGILRSMGIVPTNSKRDYYSYALIRQNQRGGEHCDKVLFIDITIRISGSQNGNDFGS
jgi:hypothetical protein